MPEIRVGLFNELIYSRRPQPRGENSVKRRWSAAALNMPQTVIRMSIFNRSARIRFTSSERMGKPSACLAPSPRSPSGADAPPHALCR